MVQITLAINQVPPSHKQYVRVPLDVSVVKEMVPMYARLSYNLQKRMEQGKPLQNNKSTHRNRMG